MIFIKKNFFYLLIIFFPMKKIFPQDFLLKNKNLIEIYEKFFYDEKEIHTSIKTFFISGNKNFQNFEKKMPFFEKKIFLNSNFFTKKNGNYKFSLFPILELFGSLKAKTTEEAPYLSMGLSENFKSFKNPYEFSAGFSAKMNYNKKFFFYWNFAYSLKNFQNYELLDSTKIVKNFGESIYQNKSFYRFLKSDFLFVYSLNKYFSFHFGKDKHFFGDGFRSLFLSRNSNSFPFYKISTKFSKFHYINLMGFLQDFDFIEMKNNFSKKYINLHFLSFNLNEKFNINIFEAIIWAEKDSIKNRDFEVNYLNPIIFYRPLENSVGSPDNVILGAGFKFEIIKNYYLYGQTILDEFLLSEIKNRNGWKHNKFGFQIGIKIFDFLSIKNLKIQSEYNYVRPFTYSHSSILNNYGSYYQALAHPLGANFREGILNLFYRKNRFFIKNLSIFSVQGMNKNNENYGQNIYLSYLSAFKDYGNKTTQGEKNYIFYNENRLSYLINPNWNLYFEISYIFMMQKYMEKNISNSFMIGLKTYIF